MQGKYALDSMGVHCVKHGLPADVSEVDSRRTQVNGVWEGSLCIPLSMADRRDSGGRLLGV